MQLFFLQSNIRRGLGWRQWIRPCEVTDSLVVASDLPSDGADRDLIKIPESEIQSIRQEALEIATGK